MRRKFTFYSYGHDIEDVIREVKSQDAAFVRSRLETPKPELLPESELAPGSHVLIAPKVLIAHLEPRDPTGSGVWVLNESQDPVIELIISRVKGNVLHSGRLYFRPQSVDSQAHLVDKSEHVRTLADELFAWARKWVRRAGGHSCGPAAAKAVREGRLELASPT